MQGNGVGPCLGVFNFRRERWACKLAVCQVRERQMRDHKRLGIHPIWIDASINVKEESLLQDDLNAANWPLLIPPVMQNVFKAGQGGDSSDSSSEGSSSGRCAVLAGMVI